MAKALAKALATQALAKVRVVAEGQWRIFWGATGREGHWEVAPPARPGSLGGGHCRQSMRGRDGFPGRQGGCG